MLRVRRSRTVCIAVVGIFVAMLAPVVHAQDDPAAPSAAAPAAADTSASATETASEADYAKKLSNPVAALISVPFQSNFDDNIGRERDGQKYTLNIQPVIPLTLTDDWNLISRTIVPVVSQSDVARGSGVQTGLGDTLQSLFFAPTKVSKLIWGVGPALLIPTGTEALLSTGKWSLGPTFVVLTQTNGWTVGALANQLWSFAGNSSRPEYNKFYFQPFLNYTTKTAMTLGLSTEGTYDWQGHGLSMPLIATLSQVGKIYGQLFSIGLAAKYYVATTPDGPHGFGGRITLTFLFPRH
jgi:hypothetical protein